MASADRKFRSIKEPEPFNAFINDPQIPDEKHLSQLTLLRFSDNWDLTDDQLATFLKAASKLRKLVIQRCNQIKGNALMQLRSDQLTSFEFESKKQSSLPIIQICSHSLAHLISQKLKLQELVLKKCFLTPSFADLYSQRKNELCLKKLTRLELDNMNIEDCSQLMGDAMNLQNLAIVNCSHYEISPPDLNKKFPDLKTLKIVNTKVSGSSILSLLQNSHDLTDLELENTEERCMDWDKMQLNSLLRLKISSSIFRDSFFTGRDFKIVARKAPNLENLSINLTTEETFEDLDGMLTRLKSVEIQGDLSDEQLDGMLGGSESLERFEMVKSDGTQLRLSDQYSTR